MTPAERKLLLVLTKAVCLVFRHKLGAGTFANEIEKEIEKVEGER